MYVYMYIYIYIYIYAERTGRKAGGESCTIFKPHRVKYFNTIQNYILFKQLVDLSFYQSYDISWTSS